MEHYQVVTEDGYILALYRIPGNLTETPEESQALKKPPVLLQHGLEADMMQWVTQWPDVAHAFVLSRAGYDVWLGNNRGTTYSLGHVSLKSSSKEYWQFDWEEMGVYDTPAVIDFILKQTGFPQLSYIGHSEGTTQVMAGAALKPDLYSSKINIAFFLAPPASMKHNDIAINKILTQPLSLKLILDTLDAVHVWNLLPRNYLTSKAMQLVCQLSDNKLCDLVLAMFFDRHPEVDDLDRWDVMASYVPSGASCYNFVHYGQLMRLEKEGFRRYDYGSASANQEHYGQD